MNALIDRVFERGAILVAFIIGSFHLLNVSGLFVLSTRDIRVFHLIVFIMTSYHSAEKFCHLANPIG